MFGGAEGGVMGWRGRVMRVGRGSGRLRSRERGGEEWACILQLGKRATLVSTAFEKGSSFATGL